MARTMPASKQSGHPQHMTLKQAGEFGKRLAAFAAKHRTEVPKSVAQQILGAPGIGASLFEPIRRRVNLSTEAQVVREVTLSGVNGDFAVICQAQQYAGHRDPRSIAQLPSKKGRTIRLIYFAANGLPEAIEQQYAQLNLQPYPLAQLIDYAAEPNLPASLPKTGCQWRDGQGNFHAGYFLFRDGKLYVELYPWDARVSRIGIFAGTPIPRQR